MQAVDVLEAIRAECELMKLDMGRVTLRLLPETTTYFPGGGYRHRYIEVQVKSFPPLKELIDFTLACVSPRIAALDIKRLIGRGETGEPE